MSTAPMTVRTGVTSSIGHIEALGVLADFTPAAGKRVVVEELYSVVRADLPLMLMLYWQYDGKLSFGFHTGRKWQTEEEMDIMVDAFKGWMLDLIA